MTAEGEWVQGTIDPKNGLERGPVPGSWQRSIPLEEQGFNEERDRPLLVRIANQVGSQQMVNFINRIYGLKDKITLD